MTDLMTTPREPEMFKPTQGSRKVLGIFFLLGSLGLVASAVGAFTDTAQFAFSWLFAFMVAFTLCAGSFFWVLLHHATNAGWSTVIRRQLENVASLFPYVVILFLPIVFVAPHLYEWMDKGANAHNPIWLSKRAYLNDTFFWIRAGLYLGYFVLASRFFASNSIKQDTTGDPYLSLKMRKCSYGFIPLFAFSIAFAAFDWLMTLDYTWFSTMWGVYIFAGATWSSMALLILIVTALKSAGYLKNIVNMEHYHLMGKLLLAFTVFWAYIAFSQYFLIWYANIPEETTFYFHRNTGDWKAYGIAFEVLGHFFVTFVLLLTQWVKRKPALLCGICIWVILMHMADMYWIIMPAFHKDAVHVSWQDIAAIVGILGSLAYLFLKRLDKHSLYANKDPRLEESLYVKN
jgi:hypothetical protein